MSSPARREFGHANYMMKEIMNQMNDKPSNSNISHTSDSRTRNAPMRPCQFLEEKKWPRQDQRKDTWFPITNIYASSTSDPSSVSQCKQYCRENSQSTFDNSISILNSQSESPFLLEVSFSLNMISLLC